MNKKEYYEKLIKLKREYGRSFKNQFRTRKNYTHGDKSRAIYTIERK